MHNDPVDLHVIIVTPFDHPESTLYLFEAVMRESIKFCNVEQLLQQHLETLDSITYISRFISAFLVSIY